MQVRRTVWFGAGAIAVATWLAAATTSGVRTSVPPPAPDPPSELDRAYAGLQRDVGRLQQRMAPAAAPMLQRDPFRFQTPVPRAGAPALAQARALVPVPAAVEPGPPLSLVGIAEDPGPEGVVRTAIVSSRGDVLLLRPGDVVADRFRVVRIDGQSLELRALDSDAPVTLTLP